MQLIEVKNKQSVADIATEHAGSVESAIEIALVNDLSLTEDVEPGVLLQKTGAKNSEVINFFERELKSPATKSIEEMGSGIGFMKIGVDFTIK